MAENQEDRSTEDLLDEASQARIDEMREKGQVSQSRELVGLLSLLAAAAGSSWPTTSGRPGGIQIEYYAGYGDGAASVPDTARQAILHLVAHWYEHREAVVAGVTVATMPKTIQSMLDDHRIWHQW
jgi:uncharacterized phiE125 gp8 family phage protein